MPFVSTADGARVHFSDSGPVDGRAVVFGHGFFMDMGMFAPQVEYLEQRGYRVLCWDARGHGDTTAPAHHAFTYWDSARDMLAVMTAADIESAVVAGMSQGGYAALRAALLAPERVEALVLLDTEAGASNEDEIASYRTLFNAWMDLDQPLDGLIGPLAAQLIGGSAADQLPWQAKWRCSDRAAIRHAAEALIGRESLLPCLGRITCPALVVRGELDRSSTAAKSQALADGLPGAGDVATIADAGHAASWTHPATVNDILAQFLTALPAARVAH